MHNREEMEYKAEILVENIYEGPENLIHSYFIRTLRPITDEQLRYGVKSNIYIK